MLLSEVLFKLASPQGMGRRVTGGTHSRTWVCPTVIHTSLPALRLQGSIKYGYMRLSLESAAHRWGPAWVDTVARFRAGIQREPWRMSLAHSDYLLRIKVGPSHLCDTVTGVTHMLRRVQRIETFNSTEPQAQKSKYK